MSVHSGGPRLFRSIPFRHIAANLKGGGGGKGVNIYLNVTPFVDMMTILVTFLLMTFSASGELISAQRGLQLPDAANKEKLREAPLIIITRDSVTFQGEPMAQVGNLIEDNSMEWKIIELYDRLSDEHRRFMKDTWPGLSADVKKFCQDPLKAQPGQVCPRGLVILQADKDTPAKVLNRVLKTAYAAAYPNIMFAVNLRASRPR